MEGATEVIYATLRKWPDLGRGPRHRRPGGPYIQTERRALYGKYAELLVEKGHAYYCFREKTESEEDSGNFDRAADPCRDMSLEEARAKVAAGAPYVIRQKIPAEGSTVFSDAVFGDITVENSTLDDQVLIKRDGLPTYNFANVIDDHLMGITHVVRGSEYLSSAPKYNLLYQGFGWDVPTYIHCSPVMRDAHNKMSKRKGDPSYEDLIAMGYLSEAVVNYVTLLGWSPRGEYAEREFFTLAELAEIFDIGGISKSPAIFDIEKLTYFNAHYLREMSPEASMRPPCPTSARRCRIPPSPRRRSPGCSRPGASVSPTSQRSWTFLTPCPTTTRGCSPTRSPRPIRRCPGGCWRPSFPPWRGWPTGPWTGFMTL